MEYRIAQGVVTKPITLFLKRALFCDYKILIIGFLVGNFID